MQKFIQFEDDEGVEHQLPAKWEICHRCDGNGVHVNPSVDGHGITAEEMAEWDDDTREGYFSGRYDIPCIAPGCESGKQLIVDMESCEAQGMGVAAREYLESLWDAEMDARADEAIRRMESGGL